MGGDFNILRFSSGKNKNFHRSRWSDVFNNIINTHELRELYLNGGKYTWRNNQENLDRVMVNKEWENLFPLPMIRKELRYLSWIELW